MLTRGQILQWPRSDRILGAFYTGAVFSSFMTNYSELYIEDLTVDSTLKHFVNSKKDFKVLMSKKIQNHVNLLVSQMQALNFSMRGVLGTRNKSKTHKCERNLSPMILKGNQMVYSLN